MEKEIRKSSFKGLALGLLLFISVGFFSVIWLYIAVIAHIRNGGEENLMRSLHEAGIWSISGLVFMVCLAVLAYSSARVCTRYSNNDAGQRRLLIVLAILLFIPAVALGLFFVGATNGWALLQIGFVVFIATSFALPWT